MAKRHLLLVWRTMRSTRLLDPLGGVDRVSEHQNRRWHHPPKLVAPTHAAIGKALAEVAAHRIEAVVVELRSDATDNSHWNPRPAAANQSCVPPTEGLVGDDALRSAFQTALARVDDDIALIVVGIDAREDHRRRWAARRIVNAGLDRSMQARFAKGTAIPKSRASLNARDIAQKRRRRSHASMLSTAGCRVGVWPPGGRHGLGVATARSRTPMAAERPGGWRGEAGRQHPPAS